jgi:hypothetical protein
VRAFWIGLGAGVVLVGLGVLIGVQIDNPEPTPQPPITTPDPAAVRITGAQSNAGWIIHFHLPERARAIEIRRDNGAWIALGPNPHDLDLATGQPRPKTYAILELSGPALFSVRYTNDAGHRRGPFDLPFDPTAEATRALASLLDDLPRWIELRRFDGKLLAYFTTLVVYKPALSAIRYGFDGPPATALPFARSDRLGVEPTDQLSVEVPPRTKEIAVEVELRDGRRVVKTFNAR